MSACVEQHKARQADLGGLTEFSPGDYARRLLHFYNGSLLESRYFDFTISFSRFMGNRRLPWQVSFRAYGFASKITETLPSTSIGWPAESSLHFSSKEDIRSWTALRTSSGCPMKRS